MTVENLETHWSRELQADVQLMETDYAGIRIFIDAAHVHTAGSFGEVENFLSSLALLAELEKDGF